MLCDHRWDPTDEFCVWCGWGLNLAPSTDPEGSEVYPERVIPEQEDGA